MASWRPLCGEAAQPFPVATARVAGRACTCRQDVGLRCLLCSHLDAGAALGPRFQGVWLLPRSRLSASAAVTSPARHCQPFFALAV